MKSLWIVLGWMLIWPSTSFAETDELAESVEQVTLEAAAEDVEPSLVLEAGTEEADVASEALSEDQIVLFDRPKSTPVTESLGSGGATLITVGVGLTLLLGGFVLMRKWVRKAAGNGTPLQIKIIGQHYLGPKKSLAVVRVAGESILIGITDHNISCIKSLSLLEEELPGVEAPQSFSDELTRQDPDRLQDSEDGENFAIAPLAEIKDRVSSKLRTMREI